MMLLAMTVVMMVMMLTQMVMVCYTDHCDDMMMVHTVIVDL